MNYFRSVLIQRVAGIIVSVALLFAVIIPLAGYEISAKDRAAVQLFGRSLDIPVDGIFLSAWHAALQSKAPSLEGFVEAFVGSYERSNGIAPGSLRPDSHALWTILKGISLNIDPWGLAATLSSSLKSGTISSTTKYSAAGQLSAEYLSEIRWAQVPARHGTAEILVRSLLTSVNPQGP